MRDVRCRCCMRATNAQHVLVVLYYCTVQYSLLHVRYSTCTVNNFGGEFLALSSVPYFIYYFPLQRFHCTCAVIIMRTVSTSSIVAYSTVPSSSARMPPISLAVLIPKIIRECSMQKNIIT